MSAAGRILRKIAAYLGSKKGQWVIGLSRNLMNYAVGQYALAAFPQFQFLVSRLHWMCNRNTSRRGWNPDPKGTVDQLPEGQAVGTDGTCPQVRCTSVAWQPFLGGGPDGVSTTRQCLPWTSYYRLTPTYTGGPGGVRSFQDWRCSHYAWTTNHSYHNSLPQNCV